MTAHKKQHKATKQHKEKEDKSEGWFLSEKELEGVEIIAGTKKPKSLKHKKHKKIGGL